MLMMTKRSYAIGAIDRYKPLNITLRMALIIIVFDFFWFSVKYH